MDKSLVTTYYTGENGMGAAYMKLGKALVNIISTRKGLRIII